MEHGGFVYMMSNEYNTTIYVGVTSNLIARVLEHKEGKYSNGFTHRYNVDKLVYFEGFHSIEEAIGREKQLKAGNRKRKVMLIESQNPKWEDLFEKIKEW